MPLEVRVPNPMLKDTETQYTSTESPAVTVQNDIAAEEQKAVSTNVRNPALIKQAFTTGATEDDIVGYLAENGIDVDEARTMVTNSVKAQVLEAQKTGAPNEEIEAAMLRNNFHPDVIKRAIESTNPKSKYYYDPNTVMENAKDLADVYKNVHGKYSTTGKLIGGVFDDEMALQARQEINELNFGVVDTLNKHGIMASISPDDGEIYITRPNGAVEPLDSSMLNDLWNSKMNITGSIAGASLGFTGGAAVGGAIGSVVPGIGTAVGAAVGGTIGMFGGSAVGGSLGTAADLTLNSYKLKEQLSTQLYKNQMVEAGIADITMGLALKAGIATSKALGKVSMSAFNYIKNGNEAGALAQLVDSLHMTKEQAAEWVDAVKTKLTSDMTVKSHTANMLSFGKAPVKNVKMSPNQESITALLNTHPLAEAYVKDVAAEDHTIANSIAISVNERAKGLTRAIDNITDANTGALVRKDLNTYIKDVDNFYGLVKEQGIKHVQGTDFKFDLQSLAIDPVFKDIEKSMPPRMQERFLAYMTRIDTATVDRSFEGLINLRQAINEFKYGVSGLNPPQLASINKVLNNVDSQISKAAKEYIPEHKIWLANFSKAKAEYAKKKTLEENILFRQLTRDTGNTENSIQNLLNKFGNDKDVDLETLNPVLERLSPRTRMLTEGAALRNLASKHTYGDATGFQAINFPELAAEMHGLNAKMPEVKAVMNAIDEIAKVFRNDEALAKVSGSVAVRQTSTQGIATTIEGRAKSMIMTQIGRTIMARLPGKIGRNSALIKIAAGVLQDPLKTTNVEKLIKEVPEASQPIMRSLVKELQVEVAKQNMKNGAKHAQWQNMYKQSASGKLVETDGMLGRGIYLVDKVKNPKPGANIVKHEVNMTRMATLDSISQLVGKQVTEADLPLLLKNTNLREQLIEQKMLGIKLDGKAVLFPDTVLGVKPSNTVKKTTDVTMYRGVSGDYPDKEFTFWTPDKKEAEAYSKGVALTNDGSSPRVLTRKMTGGKGRDINSEINDALMAGDDPDEVAIEIMRKEGLDWAEFMHPSSSGGKDHLVRVVRNKKDVTKLPRLSSSSLTVEQKAILQYRTGLGYMQHEGSGKLRTPEDYNWSISDLHKRLSAPSFTPNDEEFADMAEVYDRFISKKDVKRVLDSLAIDAPRDLIVTRVPNPKAATGDYLSVWEGSDVTKYMGEPTIMYRVKAGSKVVPQNDFLEPGEILVKQEDLVPLSKEGK